MIFQEQKTEKGYKYKTEDVFGEMEFESEKKLDAELLDNIFMAVFNIKSNSKEIIGEIDEIGLKYRYVKSDPWSEAEKKH